MTAKEYIEKNWMGINDDNQSITISAYHLIEIVEEYHKEKMKEIDTLNDSYMAGFKDGADWILEEITPKLIQNCINESEEIFDKEFYKNIDAIQIICKYCGIPNSQIDINCNECGELLK